MGEGRHHAIVEGHAPADDAADAVAVAEGDVGSAAGSGGGVGGAEGGTFVGDRDADVVAVFLNVSVGAADRVGGAVEGNQAEGTLAVPPVDGGVEVAGRFHAVGVGEGGHHAVVEGHGSLDHVADAVAVAEG